jgi:PAS domain S-box-containing protein
MLQQDQTAEILRLRERLADAEETLRAISAGAVDAFVVRGPDGPQIFTLSGAEEPYRLLIERMNQGALSVTTDGTILFSNTGFADLVGVPLEQIIGKPLLSFAMDEQRAIVGVLLADASRQAVRREITLKRSDGTGVPVLASIAPLPIEKSPALAVVLTDLTAQKHLQKITAAEQFARSILEQAADAVIVCDQDGKITKASWVAERLMGGELFGRLLHEAMPLAGLTDPLDSQISAKTILEKVWAGNSFSSREVRIQREGLDSRSFLLSARPLRDNTAQCLRCIITLTEVTEIRAAEIANARLAAIVTQASDAIISFALDGSILTWNAAAERLYGYSSVEAVGKSIRMLLPNDAETDVVSRVLGTGQPLQLEAVRRRKDGGLVEVMHAAAPICTPDGTIIGVSLIARDITERKRADRALRNALERNQLLMREIHHRVKNNLQIVASLLALAGRDIGDTETRAQVVALQDRIYAVARVHQRAYETNEFENIEFCGLLGEIIQDLARSAGLDNKIRLTTEGSVELASEVAVSLVLVVHELIANAIKHGTEDGVGLIDVACTHNGDSLLITVCNDGPGLPEDFDIGRMPGFGMRMVRTFVGQMKGTVGAASRDQGTIFEVRIPLRS